jgi:hypothetical protein
MNDTDTDFRPIELDLDGPPKAQAPVVYTTPEPTEQERKVAAEDAQIAARGNGYQSVGVSELGAERAKADGAAARAAGFNMADENVKFEVGSLVNAWGVENFRESRSEFEDMSTAVASCEGLIAQVATEKRTDLKVSAPDLTMLPDGRLSRGSGALPMSDRAITGLAGFVTPGGGRYLRDCPEDLRATNFNHWLERAYREDVYATRRAEKDAEEGTDVAKVMVPRDLTLRTRLNPQDREGCPKGTRENFAVVGPRYAAHDIDAIAEQVLTAKAIPADARANITYDGYKARMDVLFHTNIQPERAVAGEVFKAGIIVRTADDGTGSIQIGAQVWRNLCLNLIIIDHDVIPVSRRRHVGTNIDLAVEEGIAAAMAKVAHFAEAWSSATVENVCDKYDMGDIDEVLRGLVFNRVVHVPHCKPEEMFGRLKRAWEMEPGYSKTSIVNAVTRAAHENPWGRWTDVQDLEETGGQLLFQPVWNVVVPEDTDLASLGY